MKGILIFILFFFISAEIKAQVGVTSLKITLSDVQSVKIIELPAQSKAKFTEKTPGKGKVIILNPAASQVREIESPTEVKEPASQQNNKGSKMVTAPAVFSGSGNTKQMTNLNQGTQKNIPLVVYQFDPR
jgi:hypothetical protein